MMGKRNEDLRRKDSKGTGEPRAEEKTLVAQSSALATQTKKEEGGMGARSCQRRTRRDIVGRYEGGTVQQLPKGIQVTVAGRAADSPIDLNAAHGGEEILKKSQGRKGGERSHVGGTKIAC